MGFGESVGPVEGLTLHDNARDVAVAIEKTSAAPAIMQDGRTETVSPACLLLIGRNLCVVSCLLLPEASFRLSRR